MVFTARIYFDDLTEDSIELCSGKVRDLPSGQACVYLRARKHIAIREFGIFQWVFPLVDINLTAIQGCAHHVRR